MIQKARIRRLQDLVRKENLEAFVVTDQPDLIYLAEFAMAEGYWMVVSPDNWWVITNRLLDGAFRDMGVPASRLKVRMDFKAQLQALSAENKWKKVGFDGQGASYELGKFFESLGFENRPRFLTPLRIIKDAQEIKRIRKSCQITARSMRFIEKKIRPGTSERYLAYLIENFMRRNGAEKTSFDLIVGSGPNSAVPHYRTGQRKLKAGDAVVVDIGCVYENYCSDMTRTFYVGKKPSELFRKVYDIVARSQKAGVQKVRAGLTGRDVDGVCRGIIEQEGYGKAFTHGTGHGVGIEIHEAPWVRAKSENVLGPGMVVTVEPGIYLDGKFGVRIEDTVLVTRNGAEVLTCP